MGYEPPLTSGEGLMLYSNLWADPIGKLESLRIAMKYLLTRRKISLNERLTAATLPLVGYLPHEFPEVVRPRFERIAATRSAVCREYVGGTMFEFSELNRQERRALQEDIIALYEACLLDLGMADKDFYEIAYPPGRAKIDEGSNP